MVPDPQKHQIWIADANSQWHLKDIHKHKCGNKVICTNNSQQREGCQDVWHTKLQYSLPRFSAQDLWNWQPFRLFHSPLHSGSVRHQRWSATNTPRFLNLECNCQRGVKQPNRTSINLMQTSDTYSGPPKIFQMRHRPCTKDRTAKDEDEHKRYADDFGTVM